MIREFDKADLDKILEIETESFPKTAFDKKTFLYYWKSLRHKFLVYENKGILGYVVFSLDGYVDSIVVAKQNRKRGIGKTLMQEVIRAVKNQTKEIKLHVRKKNMAAQLFYQNLGFSIVREVPRYYGNEDGYEMRLKLCE